MLWIEMPAENTISVTNNAKKLLFIRKQAMERRLRRNVSWSEFLTEATK